MNNHQEDIKLQIRFFSRNVLTKPKLHPASNSNAAKEKSFLDLQFFLFCALLFPEKDETQEKKFFYFPPLFHPLGFAPSTFPVWVISAGLFFSPS